MQRLAINQAPNDSVPYELQKYVSTLNVSPRIYALTRSQYSKDIWAARQRAVLMKGSRYLKPRFEIIFAVFMFLCVFSSRSPPLPHRPGRRSRRSAPLFGSCGIPYPCP